MISTLKREELNEIELSLSNGGYWSEQANDYISKYKDQIIPKLTKKQRWELDIVCGASKYEYSLNYLKKYLSNREITVKD